MIERETQRRRKIRRGENQPSGISPTKTEIRVSDDIIDTDNVDKILKFFHTCKLDFNINNLDLESVI